MSDDSFAPDHLEGVEYIMRKQNNDLLGGIIAQQQIRIEELEAKLAQQDDLVQAAVAAALREAAGTAKEIADQYVGYMSRIERAILALIPQDAQAALDRVVAAERERCAKVAEQKAGAGSHAIAGAIRKGGE